MPAISPISPLHIPFAVSAETMRSRASTIDSQLIGVRNVTIPSESARPNARRYDGPDASREANLRRRAEANLSSWQTADPHWLYSVTEGLTIKPGEGLGTSETLNPILASSNRSRSDTRRASKAPKLAESERPATESSRQIRATRHHKSFGEVQEESRAMDGSSGLKQVDCRVDVLSWRPAKGGSNKAAMIAVRESQSEAAYRVKDARVPAWWLNQFEPRLASSMELRSNFYPAMEVTMAQVFKASGLDAPLIRLGSGCDYILYPNATDGSAGDLYAMSRFDENYIDLGKFLTSVEGRNQILNQFPKNTEQYREAQRQYQKIVNKYYSVCERQKRILAGRQYYELDGRDSASINLYRKLDRERFHALEQLNQLLPDDLLLEQEQHYLMSRFIDNWDHLNFRMENFGFTNTPSGWRGETVDFDVTGPLGYMGVPKSMGHRIANLQRPPALFVLKIRSEAYDDFSQNHSPSLIGLGEQPYGEQSATSIQRVREGMDNARYYHDKRSRHFSDPRCRAALEFGYRLTKLTDDVIKSIVLHNWQAGPAEFDLNPDRLSDILMGRRDSMLDQIGLTWIEKWCDLNPERVGRVDAQVENAMSELKIG